MKIWETGYFSPDEFDSPDAPGSGMNMKEVFMQRLIAARILAGIPFVITSGYRTPQHNASVGGTSDSAHLRGRAADIACTSDRDRWIIIDALQRSGFTRIGIAKGFIHVDEDFSKRALRVWVY